ncbi:hypothetical protein MMC12_002635 [Toensbergia leucococca]|nr:hypothetical protein [Toensbergia leucococca]
MSCRKPKFTHRNCHDDYCNSATFRLHAPEGLESDFICIFCEEDEAAGQIVDSGMVEQEMSGETFGGNVGLWDGTGRTIVSERGSGNVDANGLWAKAKLEGEGGENAAGGAASDAHT